MEKPSTSPYTPMRALNRLTNNIVPTLPEPSCARVTQVVTNRNPREKRNIKQNTTAAAGALPKYHPRADEETYQNTDGAEN